MKKKKLISMLLIGSIVASMGLVGCEKSKTYNTEVEQEDIEVSEKEEDKEIKDSLFTEEDNLVEIPFAYYNEADDTDKPETCKQYCTVKLPADAKVTYMTEMYTEKGYYHDRFAETSDRRKVVSLLSNELHNTGAVLVQISYGKDELQIMIAPRINETEEFIYDKKVDTFKDYDSFVELKDTKDGHRAFMLDELFAELDKDHMLHIKYEGSAQSKLSNEELGMELYNLISFDEKIYNINDDQKYVPIECTNDENSELSDDLSSITAVINDKAIELPCKLSDIDFTGYKTFYDKWHWKAYPDQETYIKFTNDNEEYIKVKIVNYSDDVKEFKDCDVLDLSTNSKDVVFPSNIHVGDNEEDISVFGEADERNSYGDTKNTYRYKIKADEKHISGWCEIATENNVISEIKYFFTPIQKELYEEGRKGK